MIRSDFLAKADSVLVCLLAATPRPIPLYRLSIAANETTCLYGVSQVTVDKIMDLRRSPRQDR